LRYKSICCTWVMLCAAAWLQFRVISMEVFQFISGCFISANIVNPSLLEVTQTLESFNLNVKEVMESIVSILEIIMGCFCFINNIQVFNWSHCSVAVVNWQERCGSVHLKTKIWVFSHYFCVDFVFFCLSCVDNITNSVFDAFIISVGSFFTINDLLMEGSKCSWLTHLNYTISCCEKNLCLSKSCWKWHFLFTSEIVLLDVLAHEYGGLFLNLIEISQILGLHSISFWELNSSLHIIWKEWKSLSSRILNTTKLWDMEVMVDLMCTTGNPSIQKL
jgi:hypothetical protein